MPIRRNSSALRNWARRCWPGNAPSISPRERYERGLTDFLNVVDAERQFYDLQEQYAAAQVAQGEQFVQLYKSLGGGWENYQAVPADPAAAAGDHRRISARPCRLFALV